MTPNWHPSAIAADARPLSFAAEPLVRSLSCACRAGSRPCSMDDVQMHYRNPYCDRHSPASWDPDVRICRVRQLGGDNITQLELRFPLQLVRTFVPPHVVGLSLPRAREAAIERIPSRR